MNIMRLFLGEPKENPSERRERLEMKLKKVKAGDYILKSSDGASSLSELQQKLEKEISSIGA